MVEYRNLSPGESVAGANHLACPILFQQQARDRPRLGAGLTWPGEFQSRQGPLDGFHSWLDSGYLQVSEPGLDPEQGLTRVLLHAYQ